MEETVPTAQQRFSSGTAVITGAGSGIGEGLARHAAALGMTVVVADIDSDRAELVANSVIAHGGNALPHVVDVADAASIEDLAGSVFERYGSVELLVNNAGVENAGLLWEVDVERWNTVMAINVNGVFHGVRSFVPRMITRGTPAVIVNMSSVGGLTSSALQAPYIVSKHAVLALTECLHQEVALAGAPIQVSAVLPGPVRSGIFSSALRDAPTNNVLANQMWDVLQQVNDTFAVDPLAAAAQMLDAVARGQFWISSDEQPFRDMAEARANQLRELSPPPNPFDVLKLLGITTDHAE
ncbi:MAG TPA: SDR family NAD(P)-dependent oxidoreductase [Pseudonocardiaceae bacterium]|jgi:hypothetical protein